MNTLEFNLKLTILVLVGGCSVEREVSLMTAKEVIKALKNLGHDVIPYELNADITSLAEIINKSRIDLCFNALHGKFGEDGIIQGFLDSFRMPYTHSGVLASSIAMDKYLSGIIFKSEGILIPKRKLTTWQEIRHSHPMTGKYVIKPRDEGSSIGVKILSDGEEPIGVHLDDWKYSESILIEEFIPGIEVTVPVLGDQTLPPISIHPYEGFYDYSNKYAENKALHCIPARVPPHINEEAKKTALKCHQILGCQGLSRADFIYDYNNDLLYLLEINTQPGMTKYSLVPESAASVGMSYEDICNILIRDAMKMNRASLNERN